MILDHPTVEDDVREPVRGGGKHPPECRFGRTGRWDGIDGQHHLGEQCRFLGPLAGELFGRDTGEALGSALTGGHVG